ncbi:hypothetical protein D9M71_50720 [compost metagenome]
MLGQALEARQQFVERLGAVQQRTDFLQPGLQLAQRFAAGQRHRGKRCAGQLLGIRQPAAGLGDERFATPFLAGIGQHDQVSGEIATVHRRYVARVQRAQVAGVVPVEEVPLEARQLLHAGERGFQPFDGFQAAGPAEIARGDRGQQVQADVGRRRAMRHHRLRLLLEVVRRQVVLLRRDEGFEEAPGTPGDQPQLGAVGRQQGALPVERRRPAAVEGQHRRRQPEQGQRYDQRPG